MGSWPVLPSPLGARLRSGTEDNGELSWHCHPSGCPMPRANREQRQRYRGVLGPLPLVCLGRSRSRGGLVHPGQSCSQPRRDPQGPNSLFLALFLATWEMAQMCPRWGSEQLHSQGTAASPGM